MGRAAAGARRQATPKCERRQRQTHIKAHLKVFADKGVISKYGIPEKILFVDRLPKTSVGKINKKELREKYGARCLDGSSASRERIREVTQPHPCRT